MNKEDVIRRIGLRNWDPFIKFMKGQTVGVAADGSIDYYDTDVRRFLNSIRKGQNLLVD